MALKKTDMAYIAGLVDGEGSIVIAKSYSTVNGNCYRIAMTITNTNLAILDWVNDKFGGYVCNNKINPHIYMWQLNGRKCYKFLEKIYPYLRIKKEQAKIAFEFISTIPISGDKSERRKVYKHRKVLRNKMQKLNGCKRFMSKEEI